eukprot:gene116-biopygen6434
MVGLMARWWRYWQDGDVGMDATGHVMEGRWEGCPRRGVLRFKRTE